MSKEIRVREDMERSPFSQPSPTSTTQKRLLLIPKELRTYKVGYNNILR